MLGGGLACLVWPKLASEPQAGMAQEEPSDQEEASEEQEETADEEMGVEVTYF